MLCLLAAVFLSVCGIRSNSILGPFSGSFLIRSLSFQMEWRLYVIGKRMY